MNETLITAASSGININFGAVLIALAVVGGAGLLIGLALGIVGKKFEVGVDEKAAAIRECLPGNNCGSCGYAGCDALAAAISSGVVGPNGCPVCNQEAVDQISDLLGMERTQVTPMVAIVRCSGNCSKTTKFYNYYGPHDCRLAYLAPGHGSKKCYFGCCGFGTCAEVCPQGAIKIVDELAVVDHTKCIGCGVCLNACPNHLIDLVPKDSKYYVRCSSKLKGKAVREACENGCIGCTLCVRECENGAISMQDNVARIDQSKCTGCGKCVKKCPSKIIRMV